MAKKIATENEAYYIAGEPISAITIKMCTRAKAIEIGCNVEGAYKSNQLVAYENLSKAMQLFIITPQTVTLNAYGLNEVKEFAVNCTNNYSWQADRVMNLSGFKKIIYDALSPKSGVGPATITLSSIYPGVISREVITFNGGGAAITFISE